MLYSGPRCAMWHAKSRENGGANYIIAGRDMAGIYDIYKYHHAREVLRNAPYLDIKIIPFQVIAYNKKLGKMIPFNEKEKEDFLFISGTKMRGMARRGEELPNGFMNENGWKVLQNYYNNL